MSPYIAIFYVFAAGMAWAALTPPGGVPDEPAHITYAAAVARGDLGQIGDSGHPYLPRLPLVSVPAWVTSIDVCYAFDPTVSADCQGNIVGEGEILAPTTATWYPPAYYWVVGLPTLVLTEAPALYAMRATSVALVTALIAAGLWVATPVRRWWLSIGVILSFTPMVAHFSGAVNPSALEFGAVIGLSAALLGIAAEGRDTVGGRSSKRAWGQAVTVVVIAGLLGWARPWSILMVGAVAVGSILLNYRGIQEWSRAHRLPTVLSVIPALVLIVGAVVFELALRVPIGREVAENATGPALGESSPLFDNATAVLGTSFAWTQQQIGLFGWLDHGAPPLVIAGWIVFVGFLLLYALGTGTRWHKAVLGATVVGATVIAPLFIIEFTFGSTKGYQARYHLAAVLALVAMVTFVLGMQARVAPSDALRTVTRWAGAFAPMAMILALLASLSRYAIAGSRGWPDLAVSPISWLPPTKALITMVVSMVGLALLAPLTARLGSEAPLHPFGAGPAVPVETHDPADRGAS